MGEGIAIAISLVTLCFTAWTHHNNKRESHRREGQQLEQLIFREVQQLFDGGLRAALRAIGAKAPTGVRRGVLYDYAELDRHDPTAVALVWDRLLEDRNEAHRQSVISAVNWLDWFGNVLLDRSASKASTGDAEALLRALGAPLRRLTLIGTVQARTSVFAPGGGPDVIVEELRARYRGLIYVAELADRARSEATGVARNIERDSHSGPDGADGRARRESAAVGRWIRMVVDHTPPDLRPLLGPATEPLP